MTRPVVILADNGSRRAAATLSLRVIAARLSQALGTPVHAVSLQHADHIPAQRLDGEPAWVLADFLRAQLTQGRRRFVVVPLFFGSSRALTSFIPEQVAELRKSFTDLQVDVATPLVPLPDGEPRLVDILADHAAACARTLGEQPDRIIVVDHGSPLPQVTAVREYAARELAERLPHATIEQAVMERREGPEYDFNGELLAQVLAHLGSLAPSVQRVAVLMLFLLPGRHAGPGGDIADICERAMQQHPGLKIAVSPLVGEHGLLTDILSDRLATVMMREHGAETLSHEG